MTTAQEQGHTDPRLSLDGLTDADAEAMPAVGSASSPLPIVAGGLALALLAVVLFVRLEAQRREKATPLITSPTAGSTPTSEGLELPADLAAAVEPRKQAAPVPQAIPLFMPQPVEPAPAPAHRAPPLEETVPPSRVARRGDSPALIVDLGRPDASPRGALAAGPGPATTSGGAASAARPGDRLAGAATAGEAERARAVRLKSPGSVILQGALIPAVLETTINSDLPGYVRAVISLDIRSFDGKRVLIPRGSRLIGRYENQVAFGSSRVFVLWERLIRPDGVSIQITSPSADSQGRAGLTGKVDRHLPSRLGVPALMSILNAGLYALNDTAQVIVASPLGGLRDVAGPGASQEVSPTVETAQGSAIQVFVARDLDFSSVGEGT